MSLLRRAGQSESSAPVENETAFPSLDQPYVLGERPTGVRFYRGRESHFFPYALLQAMKLEVEKLTLIFASADIVVSGRGLHVLYVALSEQKVVCVVEQGERYQQAADGATFVSRVEVLLR